MASSRTPSAAHPQRPRSKRFSRSQLEHNLQASPAHLAMSVVSRPMLPPTLLPSPPASRSTSPNTPPAPSKRKLPADAAPATEPPKRPRTALHADVHRRTDAPAGGAPLLATAPTPGGPDPPAFPHRRGRPSAADFNRFYDRYSAHGKHLKYSADIRGQAAGAPPDAPAPRRLAPPPAAGSPYAVYAGLFARLEALEALLNFAYSMWCMDMVEGKCHHGLWDTIDLYHKWVRGRWESRWETHETQPLEGVVNFDAVHAFAGVIRLVEAYIYARKAAFMNTANSKRISDLVKPPATAANASASISPATSLGGSSQHSVPNASPPAGACPSPSSSTMATAGSSRQTAVPSSSSASSVHAPAAPAPASSSHPHTAGGVLIPRDLFESIQATHNCNARSVRAVSQATNHLTLAVLARHFPRTSARVLGSQLRPEEEFEVDFEQDECSRADGVPGAGLVPGETSPGPGEGQLVWPGALSAVGGEGIAWVCILGRAMIRELAYPLGYRGLDGILRKEAAPPR